MTFFRKQLGQSGEALAVQFLRRNGFRILARNLKFKFGEIDILAEDDNKDIVLVEVKTKTSQKFGGPLEEIDYFKKKKLWQLARALSQKYPARNIRIDVIGIKTGERGKIEHIRNAVEGS